MITSLLIANRGEIARRIIRTARRLGVRTIAVYSEADAGAWHVREADAAVCIGRAPALESYLRKDAILSAARDTGAEAIHPGYGFLSENADFAEMVIGAGLVWVGAPPSAIRAMGLKDAAKRLMAAAGVPVTPGYLGDDQSPEVLAVEAERIGWPVLIKAVAGGGGKGMRAVHAAEAFAPALEGARREAASAFGDDRVLLEKLIASPRHIEVQIFADRRGGVVHLFERDCSLQRRHQKVIEEAPAPGMDEQTRAAVCDAAVRAARSVGYEGAGTVEFIADASEGLRADRIWFMEMNTRLQVEHPVTEAVTGVDLVEWQLRVAAGEPLPLDQADIKLSGHAIEARLYAENPARGFLPSVGSLAHLRLPSAIRVDSGVEQGDVIKSFYDPMIAKLVTHAGDRTLAAEALADAVRGVEVWPVRTNAAFLARCLVHPDFVAGDVGTEFIEAHLDALIAREPPPLAPAAIAALARSSRAGAASAASSCWDSDAGLAGFRMSAARETKATVYLDGSACRLGFDFAATDQPQAVIGGETVVFRDGAAWLLTLARPEDARAGGGQLDGVVRTPMPGRIVVLTVEAGDLVRAGQTLAILEAMKMEHSLVAPHDGRVAEVGVSIGAQVAEGAAVARIDPIA